MTPPSSKSKPLQVVYLGNLEVVVESLHKMPGVKLAAWILEKEDFKPEILRFIRGKFVRLYLVRLKKEIQDALNEIGEVDLGIVANFGMILSEKNLKIPKFGFVNAHLGLLPEYPGRLPIRDMMKNKETFTGVTLHKMTSQVDEGPLISKKTISAGTKRDQLFDRLANLIPSMLAEYIRFLRPGRSSKL